MDDALKKELDEKDFRVVIFGSARTKDGDLEYEQVYELGKAIGMLGADVVTGGGPGMMEAANRGHREGSDQCDNDSHSIGIGIELPFEENMNKHLDVKVEHERFSTRLDAFMSLSNLVVITPGGVGTLLEFAYTLQLIQVGHLCKIPIVLMGDMWADLYRWIEKDVIAAGYASPEDLDVVEVVSGCEEAIAIIEKTHACFENGDFDQCLNWEFYKAR